MFLLDRAYERFCVTLAGDLRLRKAGESTCRPQSLSQAAETRGLDKV
jgi:hypothetical protein